MPVAATHDDYNTVISAQPRAGRAFPTVRPDANFVPPHAGGLAMTTSAADAAILAGAFDACPVPMLAFDRALRYTACNRAAARALGRAAERIVGLTADAAAAHRRALDGDTFTARASRLSFGGEETAAAWDLAFAPARDASGAVVGGVVTLADATISGGDAAVTDATLERAILDAMPNALFAFDAQLRVTEWNVATARNTAIERAAAMGRVVLDIFPHIRGTDSERDLRRAVAGEVIEGRDRMWTPAGDMSPRWFDVCFQPLHDASGAVIGGVVVTTDVTTRRSARDELASERSRLRSVIDAAPFGLLAVDGRRRLTEWNVHAERHAAVPRDDVVGRDLLDVLPDLAGTAILGDYERALGGETVHVRGRWYAGPLTPLRCYDVVFAPMHDQHGAVTGAVMMSIDVTDRAVAERALRDERAFLRSVIDASPSSIVAFDRDLRQTEWNYRAERNTGIRRDDALGRTTEELFPGFMDTEWYGLTRRVLDGEVLRGLDYELVVPDTGEALTLDVTMAPLYDAAGAVVGALVVSLDVTERVRTQRALEESESRYRHLFEQSAAMQMVVDGETRRVLDVNEPALAFYQYPRDVIVGMRADRLQDPPDPPDVGWLDALLRDGAAHVHRTHVTARGARRAVEIYATVITRGGRRLAHLVTHDVTDRVRAEAERDRLIAIVEAATDVVGIGDPHTQTVTYLNPAGRELLGVAPGERTLPWAELLDEDDRALVTDVALPSMLRDGAWRGELRLRARDGRVVPTSVVVIPQYDAGGRPEWVSAIIRDITAEKAREAAETAAREAAERASEAKSAFLAGMSHELRTPLGAVLGFTQLLRDGRAGPLTPTQEEFLDDVLVGARQLRALVDDALDLAHIEAGIIEVRPARVELRALVDEALVTVAPLAAERQVRLARTIADDAAHVVADPARLRQVLVNLLTNAIKFNRTGGDVRVTTAAAGAQVRLSVRDTGRGIDPADIPRLFTEFQRLGAQDIPGSGLGLAIARRITEAMGGAIDAESAPGAGSTFHLLLPGAPDAPGDAHADGAS